MDIFDAVAAFPQFNEIRMRDYAAKREAWLRSLGARADAVVTRAEANWSRIRKAKDQMGEFNAKVSEARKLKNKTTSRGLRGEGNAYGKENRTSSPGAAWLANQMGRKDIIGLAETYADSFQMAAFFSEFSEGAHAFITPNMHEMMSTYDKQWEYIKGWGKDFNFVAPLPVAEQLLHDASLPNIGGGLWELEEGFGIPSGFWVDACKSHNYCIYRYIIPNPEKLGLKMPSGSESQAYGSQWKTPVGDKTKYYGDQQNMQVQAKGYEKGWKREETNDELEERLKIERGFLSDLSEFVKGEWMPFGMTSGGMREAVLPKMFRKDFLENIKKETIKVEPYQKLSDNTQNVIDFGGWANWKKYRGYRAKHGPLEWTRV